MYIHVDEHNNKAQLYATPAIALHWVLDIGVLNVMTLKHKVRKATFEYSFITCGLHVCAKMNVNVEQQILSIN